MSEQDESETYQQYTAKYCEWCGTVVSASSSDVDADLSDVLPETVARVGVLQAIAEIAPQDIDEPVAEVGETVATEEGRCSRCGEDAVVKRYYTTGSVPSVDLDVEPEQYTGRDPYEDALIETEPGKFREVSEMRGIDTEDLE